MPGILKRHRLLLGTLVFLMLPVITLVALAGWLMVEEWRLQVRWNQKLVDESYERGAVVIAALEEYKQDHAVYPQRLEDLIPQYLTDVPQPTAGNRKWRYDLYRTGNFQLCVEDSPGGFPVHFYISDDERWGCDTG